MWCAASERFGCVGLGLEGAPRVEVWCCLRGLERARAAALTSGPSQIFNNDQGAQVTSGEFTGRLVAQDIQISMDGRGRALANIFVERLWRSVKQEEVYIHDYHTVEEAGRSLARYFTFYNHRRLHQALAYQTPAAVYWPGAGGAERPA